MHRKTTMSGAATQMLLLWPPGDHGPCVCTILAVCETGTDILRRCQLSRVTQLLQQCQMKVLDIVTAE